MKKLILAVIALIMTIGVASAQQYMYVWKTDGTYVTFTVNEVDSIGFYMPENIGGGATGGIGLFSVSETQQVTFSKGNLQYQASTNTWRFAEHQYDYIGEANKNISATYSGWIDLFGWGTGNAPTKTSTSYSAYGTFIDWGMNPISNGGNEAGLWRTLSGAEWGYLFNNRKDNAYLYGMGTIAGISGVILLPDNWVKPSGVSFWSYSEGNANDHFSDNTYTASQWQKMEDAGAVFLPAAGSRDGASVSYAGSLGYYWSSSQGGSYDAYLLYFVTSLLGQQSRYNRNYGFSVRLVRVGQSEQEPVYSLSVSVEGEGTVTGAGEYTNGTTATLTATAASGYTFSQWSDGSTDNPRTITMTQNLTLTAVFTAVGGGAMGGIGVFSVSATSKVTFSPGNLQYNAALGSHQCADGTTKQGTWRFAEHQWDMVGMGYGQTNTSNYNYNYIGGTVTDGDNRSIGSSYNGWIDLFGWGTGNAPTKNSTDCSDYQTFVDWGTNAISNGGNQANMWRTLTYDEWNYLFDSRANASSKYGVGMVNGVTGMILLPDEFTLPSGLTFNSGVASSSGYQYYQTKNNYTSAQWALMEDAGAVFLPGAGGRNGSTVSSVGQGGFYLSSTASGTSSTYGRYFYSNSTGWGRYYRDGGSSVRLVR